MLAIAFLSAALWALSFYTVRWMRMINRRLDRIDHQLINVSWHYPKGENEIVGALINNLKTGQQRYMDKGEINCGFGHTHKEPEDEGTKQ
jgi:hypothetical protein